MRAVWPNTGAAVGRPPLGVLLHLLQHQLLQRVQREAAAAVIVAVIAAAVARAVAIAPPPTLEFYHHPHHPHCGQHGGWSVAVLLQCKASRE